jgi:hypothetical protein
MSCRTTADCRGGWQCVWSLPPAGPDCSGTGAVVSLPCTSDASCASGYVCDDLIVDGCSPTTLCQVPCGMRSCDAGYTCAADGHCAPELCPDELTCSSEYVCAPGDAMADAHGCKVASCEDGYECPAGSVCQSLNSDRHGCAPLPCASGAYSCPTGTHCSPQGPYFEHGCLMDCSLSGCTPGEEDCASDEECHQKTCATDVDCGCGICVNGACKGSLGMCNGAGGTSG